MNISPQWTTEERLIAVNKIASEMARTEKLLYSRDEVLGWAQRLAYLATYSSKFLEYNRTNILGPEVNNDPR